MVAIVIIIIIIKFSPGSLRPPGDHAFFLLNFLMLDLKWKELQNLWVVMVGDAKSNHPYVQKNHPKLGDKDKKDDGVMCAHHARAFSSYLSPSLRYDYLLVTIHRPTHSSSRTDVTSAKTDVNF